MSGPTNIVSMSGGKDSTAMALLAMEREVENVRLVFADTGHEHPITYGYIEYLNDFFNTRWGKEIEVVRADFSEKMKARRINIRKKWPAAGVPAERIEAAINAMKPTGNPFLDLCKLKGTFPSSQKRFCTDFLKTEPITDQIVKPLFDQVKAVISWQGVRAEESPKRAKLPIKDVEFGHWEPEPNGFLIYRPLLKWLSTEVFDQHRRHGCDWNPLYEHGMGRVGCMPCVMARKDEIKEISERFPGEIERVEKWEKEVVKTSKAGGVSFFSTDKTTQGREALARGENPSIGIKDVAEWSKTVGFGGRQMNLLQRDGDEPHQCSSIYGLCE